MIYTVRHRTTYTYEDPVTFARCVLRLTPKSSMAQTVLESHVTVSPTPVETLARTGPFGESMLTVVVDSPHTELVIEAISRVDVQPPQIDLPFSEAWESVRDRTFSSGLLGHEGPAAYIYPTRRAPLVDDITLYGRDSFPAGRPIVEAAVDLMRRIHADFIYDGDATDVSTPPGDAFTKRRGVCQDFAHIMICALRGLGLPAAYVSGYLRTSPPPGGVRLEGADATHAWVQLWCGDERGWVGLDPTNALVVQDQHVVLAIGRDYSDVAPIDGILLAPGKQTLKVEVDVIPDGEVKPARGPLGSGVRRSSIVAVPG
jgi:transglutaminase-like putative cysteine protease